MHESSVRLTSPALTGCSGNTQLPLTTPCASSGPGSFGAGCRLTPTCHADSPAPHSCFTGRVPLVTSPDPSCCHAGSQHYDLCNKLPGKEKKSSLGWCQPSSLVWKWLLPPFFLFTFIKANFSFSYTSEFTPTTFSVAVVKFIGTFIFCNFS